MAEDKKGTAFAKGKVFGLPAPVFFIGAAVIFYFLWKSQSAKKPTTMPGAPGGVAEGQVAGLGGPGAPTTNEAWAQLAQQMGVQTGLSPVAVAQAVSDYLTGQPLTTTDQAILNQILPIVGPPPNYVPITTVPSLLGVLPTTGGGGGTTTGGGGGTTTGGGGGTTTGGGGGGSGNTIGSTPTLGTGSSLADVAAATGQPVGSPGVTAVANALASGQTTFGVASPSQYAATINQQAAASQAGAIGSTYWKTPSGQILNTLAGNVLPPGTVQYVVTASGPQAVSGPLDVTPAPSTGGGTGGGSGNTIGTTPGGSTTTGGGAPPATKPTPVPPRLQTFALNLSSQLASNGPATGQAILNNLKPWEQRQVIAQLPLSQQALLTAPTPATTPTNPTQPANLVVTTPHTNPNPFYRSGTPLSRRG